VLARSGAGSSGSALSSLMPPYRYRRSSGSSGSRSLQGPASAVLERRRLSTTSPPTPVPSPTVTTIHETPPAPTETSDVDIMLVNMTDCQQADMESSTLKIPGLPVIGQSQSDNFLSFTDRAFNSFNHATLDGFLHTT